MSYIALTIGPIYKTLKKAKKTREIWGGSYFFSFIMKQIAKKLFEKKVEFITPYVEKDIFDEKNGVGLFHDRLIIKTKEINKNDLKNLVDEVLKDIEKNSNNKIDFNFLKNYLQIHIVELDENNIKNPILDISPYLDTAELFFTTQKEDKNKLLEFIKNDLKGSFLAKDAFGNNKVSFESLPEIALSCLDKELVKTKLKDNENEIFEDEQIKKLIKNKPFMKYICIIQADGDNIGAVLNEIGKNNQLLNSFSKTFFEFCQTSTQKVKDFGGRMIYAGGDDLLFFAPIVGKDDKTIFSLCKELSKDFNQKLDNLNLDSKPSLSFGISITYYKFPLYEARENALNLLFNKAKKAPKNNIAYKVIKHSGQTFEGIVYKGDKLKFEKFLDIVEFNQKLDSNFLHSIYSKIDRYKFILKEIIDDRKRVENFFKNYFNKNYNEYKEFFNILIEYIFYTKDLDSLYSALRFKKFLLGDKLWNI